MAIEINFKKINNDHPTVTVPGAKLKLYKVVNARGQTVKDQFDL